MERTKKRVHLWKKAIAHFSLCFVMGFFTGFFPTSNKNSSNLNFNYLVSTYGQEFSAQPIEATKPQLESPQRVKPPEREKEEEGEGEGEGEGEEKEVLDPSLRPRKLVIIVTPVSEKGEFREALLRRLGNTMGLVRKPLLWIVVEGQTESNQVNEILRKTRVMYRHLVAKENFTDAEAELDHLRNVALKHIEQHRLSGIVHFAGLSNVYELQFFDELRKIEAFGTWPTALLTANRNKVTIEGPVCDSSQVIGWHLRKPNNETEIHSKPPIHISSFAFNSSILWDPERWGRTSSVQSTSQSSIKFVKQVVLEDEAEIKGIPQDGCSKIMLWRLHFPNQHKPINQSLATSTNVNYQTQ